MNLGRKERRTDGHHVEDYVFSAGMFWREHDAASDPCVTGGWCGGGALLREGHPSVGDLDTDKGEGMMGDEGCAS